MTERRRTPLQRAGTRHAAELDQDTDEFRNMMRRRQDAEEKLKKHLEGERDGRPIEPDDAAEDDAAEDPAKDAGAATDPPADTATPEVPGQASGDGTRE